MKILVSLVSVFVIGTLSVAIAQESGIQSADELLRSVPELANITALKNFNTSAVKTEDIEKVLREKCEKSGGPDAFNAAQKAPQDLVTCVEALVNVTQLQNEMEEARPHGELDTVFKKYCGRVPNLKKCVRNLTDAVEPCLDSEERENIKMLHNITNSLLEFICHNEGDRIAMFIAAGGVECFTEKQKAVTTCANQTFSRYAPTDASGNVIVPEKYSLPKLVLELKQCTDIEKFQSCAVKVLEECEDPTPANVVDSLLNFIKKVTPCSDLLKVEAAANTRRASGESSSDSISNVLNVFLLTTAMAISLRFV